IACRRLLPLDIPARLWPWIAGRNPIADEQDLVLDESHVVRARRSVVPAGPATGAGQDQLPSICRHPETPPAMRARQDRTAAIHRYVPGPSPRLPSGWRHRTDE